MRVDGVGVRNRSPRRPWCRSEDTAMPARSAFRSPWLKNEGRQRHGDITSGRSNFRKHYLRTVGRQRDVTTEKVVSATPDVSPAAASPANTSVQGVTALRVLLQR